MTDANCVTHCYFYQLRQLHCIQRFLTQNTAKIFVHAFILRRVDYCNALLFGAPYQVVQRLQAVMNALAHLITAISCFDHISSVLREDDIH